MKYPSDVMWVQFVFGTFQFSKIDYLNPVIVDET